MAWRRICCGLLLIALPLLPTGCTQPKKKRNADAIKADVAESFTRLKEAIAELREGQTEKFWDVLCEYSKAEASKRAKAFRADLAKREKEEQDDIAKQLGVRADDLREKLNGYGYIRLMSEKIYEEYLLVAGAAVDHVNLDADDAASLYYVVEDVEKDKKSFPFYLEEGEWKVKLRIP
jgi:hypothetical protein